jgi:carbonic anhydrase/acetyltransferase-like protein (isoleucine patch superfamily)
MPLFAFKGREPAVSPSAWIAPTATLVGDVRVEDDASVWYGAVLRADLGPIVVRRGANIQDGSVLHGGEDPATEIGEGVTVGHLCVVHGAVIGLRGATQRGSAVFKIAYSRPARRHARYLRMLAPASCHLTQVIVQPAHDRPA